MNTESYGSEYITKQEKVKNLEDFLARFEVESIDIEKFPNHQLDDGYDDDDDEEYNQAYVEPEPEYIEVFKFKHGQSLPFELPQGYCLEGGAARNIALASLGEKVLPPRDHDIIALWELNPDLTQREILSAQYMPDDFQNGYGIEPTNMQSYFQTRDFTINQLFIDGEDAYISKECLEDLIDKVICPTEFEQGKWNSYAYQREGVNPKLVVKSLRLYSEFVETYGQGSVDGIEGWQWNFDAIPIFYLALGLEKATQLGDKVAIRFYMTLIDLGMIEKENTPSLSVLAYNIRFHMREQGKDPFNFSDSFISNLVALLEEDDSYRDDFTKYEELAEKYVKVNKNNRDTRLDNGKYKY
jgi:hypothetical protein